MFTSVPQVPGYTPSSHVQSDLRRDEEFDLLSIILGKLKLKVITDNSCSDEG